MSRSLAFAALLSLAACPRPATTVDAGAPAAPARTALALHRSDLVPGMRWHVEHRATLVLAATTDQPDGGVEPAEAPVNDAASFDLEVLAAQGPEVTKAKVAFLPVAERTGGGPRLAGKTFLIEWGPSTAAVTFPDGKPASEGQAALVRNYADVLRPNEVQLQLARAPVQAGVELPALGTAFGLLYQRREALKGGPPARVSEVGAKLEDRADAVAVVVQFEVKTADPSMELFALLKGELELTKDTGLMRSMKFEGPVELTFKNGKSSGRLIETTTVK